MRLCYKLAPRFLDSNCSICTDKFPRWKTDLLLSRTLKAALGLTESPSPCECEVQEGLPTHLTAGLLKAHLQLETSHTNCSLPCFPQVWNCFLEAQPEVSSPPSQCSQAADETQQLSCTEAGEKLVSEDDDDDEDLEKLLMEMTGEELEGESDVDAEKDVDELLLELSDIIDSVTP